MPGSYLAQKAGRLSGGQRAQLALTLAIAKRPQLLILDEPVASLDPLARRDFLQDLLDATAEHQLSFLALALVLAAFCVWQIRHRRLS
jgi:ABC-2 type transport system ATP-binding protein